MYSALILSKDSNISNLENVVTTYLSYNNYDVYMLSEDDIPSSIASTISPVIVDTGLRLPFHTYQHYYHHTVDIESPEHNRILMSIRSTLTYLTSETLAPDELYFQLVDQTDEVSTHRKRLYKLFFHGYPCFMKREDPLFSKYMNVEPKRGPLIVSTFSLLSSDFPSWYARETFRDMVEMGEIIMDDKEMVEGENSGELYLFYAKPVNVTIYMMQDIINKIHRIIKDALSVKLFPRNTPLFFRKTHRLSETPQGQWKISYAIPENISITHQQLIQTWTFETISQLFIFLLWMNFLPTYAFIQKELKVYLKSNNIRVTHHTTYLPDFIRVYSARRVNPSEDLLQDINITYTNRQESQKIPKGLSFYDFENEENVVLSLKSYPLNFPKHSLKNYSLDQRISLDPL